ncbi:unnamed protein product [Protopolystoma xenopodis]|uniref:Uncharacterized protein n=1 Tax=Protopolystoma xenopodis TaxID=117903 RepID=A0A448X932_9PLAT|nr:unnamed protein product [Protopolystoma xenopodis]
MKVFTDVIDRFPRAKYPRRRILDVCEGHEFLLRADAFLRTNLRKGSPIFVQLAWLYEHPEKVNILESLYFQYKANLDKHDSLGPVAQIDGDATTINDKEPPSTGLWLSYLIAQHHNHLGRSLAAIQIVKEELEKTPTLIDFYVLLATIFKDAGDIISASRLMEEAQSLDTADRYINALCTKYMVQAGRLKEAEEMAAKFTRPSSIIS